MRVTLVVATALLCFSAGVRAGDALSLASDDGTRAMFYVQKSFGGAHQPLRRFNVGLRLDQQVNGVIQGSSSNLRLPAYLPMLDVKLTRNDLVLRFAGVPLLGYGQLNADGSADSSSGDSSEDSSQGDSSEDSSMGWWTADSWKNPYFIGTLVVVGGLGIWCISQCGGSSSSYSTQAQ
jgi:hypothetical protein